MNRSTLGALTMCLMGCATPTGTSTTPDVPDSARESTTEKASDTKGDVVVRFRAFRRHFEQVLDVGPDRRYFAVTTEGTVEIHDGDGNLVLSDTQPMGCTAPDIVRDRFVRVCEQRVHIYSLPAGDLVEEFDLPVEVVPGNLPTFDDNGFTYQVRAADGLFHHFSIEGAKLGTSKARSHRHGETWAHFYWFDEDEIVRTDDGVVSRIAGVDMQGGLSVHGKYLIPRRSDERGVFSVVEGAWVTDVDEEEVAAEQLPISRRELESRPLGDGTLHSNGIRGAVASRDGRYLYVSSDNGLVKRWDLDDGSSERIDVPHHFAQAPVVEGPPGCLLFRGNPDSRHSWNPRMVAMVGELTIDATEVLVICDDFRKSLSFDTSIVQAAMPDAETVAVVSTDNRLIWRDLATGKTRRDEAGLGVLARDGSFYFLLPFGHAFQGETDAAVYDGITHELRFAVNAEISGCASSSPGAKLLSCSPRYNTFGANVLYDPVSGDTRLLYTPDQSLTIVEDCGEYALSDTNPDREGFEHLVSADGIVRSAGVGIDREVVSFLTFAPGGRVVVRGLEDIWVEELP